MARMFAPACLIMISIAGCANRSGWGFPWGQGTMERQRARAVIHDPYPLNDIGPEVVGGRPRDFYNPQSEAKRAQLTRNSPINELPSSFVLPPR